MADLFVIAVFVMLNIVIRGFFLAAVTSASVIFLLIIVVPLHHPDLVVDSLLSEAFDCSGPLVSF